MALKNVELVRKRVANGFGNEIVRFRAWLSCVDGNQEAVEALRSRGDELLAVVIEAVMTHIGHDTILSAAAETRDRRSQAGKAARGAV